MKCGHGVHVSAASAMVLKRKEWNQAVHFEFANSNSEELIMIAK